MKYNDVLTNFHLKYFNSCHPKRKTHICGEKNMNKVIVVGSINMDVITRVARLPQTGETVSGYSAEYLPGGKGLNQAAAFAKMGIETILAGCLGQDVFADRLYDFIKKLGIKTDYIRRCDKESGTAFINVAENGQNTIVVVPGSNAELSADKIAVLPIDRGDVVICQFEIPLNTVMETFAKAKKAGATTLLNPSPIRHIPSDLLAVTDILVVNETELGFLCGKKLSEQTSAEEIAAAANNIRPQESQTIIVTLGSRGALIAGQDVYFAEGHKVNAIDTVGAGDCFAGVVAARLLTCKDLRECVRTANLAASICVTRKGAAPAMPHHDELFS